MTKEREKERRRLHCYIFIYRKTLTEPSHKEIYTTLHNVLPFLIKM